MTLSVGSRPARQREALTMGGILFDDVSGMVGTKGALKDGRGVFCAKIDDGVKEAQWMCALHY